MKLKFTKMHGIKNDYIYFNCFETPIQNPSELAIKLSDRNASIGGDGIVLICPSEVADAKMRMFNIDGTEGKMCGNAIRCVAKYLYDFGIKKSTTLTIETLSGIKHLDLTLKDDKVSFVTVNMGAAILNSKEIPVLSENDNVINQPLCVEKEVYNITCVSMGNPHCVVFVNNPDEIDLLKIGPSFEKNEIFPEQVNTEFIQVINKNTLKMRVFERGSGETLACGTGACAAVVAATLNGHCNEGEDVTVKLRGGELVINYTKERVLMTGAAEVAFVGEVEV